MVVGGLEQRQLQLLWQLIDVSCCVVVEKCVAWGWITLEIFKKGKREGIQFGLIYLDNKIGRSLTPFVSRDSPFLFSWHGYGHGYVMGL
jgi:hypothetical protein